MHHATASLASTSRRARAVCTATALLFAAAAGAQVTPAEPFGGRPFGSNSAPAPAPAAQPNAGGGMGGQAVPGMMPAPQGAVVPAVPVVPVVPAMPQPMPQAMPGMGGGAPAPSTARGTQGGAGGAPQTMPLGTPAPAPQTAQPPPMPAPAPAAASPAPAPVNPPFSAGGAPAARQPPPIASNVQQQPVRGLPADAPKLVISGGTYSSDPGQRMLIVNGQVFREGADLGSGVVLEQVKPEGAVLGYKGARYNVLF